MWVSNGRSLFAGVTCLGLFHSSATQISYWQNVLSVCCWSIKEQMLCIQNHISNVLVIVTCSALYSIISQTYRYSRGFYGVTQHPTMFLHKRKIVFPD